MEASDHFQALRPIVCITICPLTCSTTITAKFHEEIRMAIPSIVECLKDSDSYVRRAALEGLPSLAAHRMSYYLSPFDVLAHDCS